MASEEPPNIPVTVQLVKYKPVPWLFRNDLPEPPVTTPSQWFSKRWPQQAETFGTPFLEATYLDGDLEKHVNPISLNAIFFASILAGNQELGHKLVYYATDEEFYFKDPREGGIFKPVTEDKLKTLMSLYILECAEQLTAATPMLSLFIRFRKDDELQAIVNKARSLLAVDKSFFGADSPNIRTGGAEEKELPPMKLWMDFGVTGRNVSSHGGAELMGPLCLFSGIPLQSMVQAKNSSCLSSEAS